MNFTRDELNMMPLLQLRGMDIKDREDELLVQEVINEKLSREPHVDPNRFVFNSSHTDKITPEKEAILQAELDAKNAKAEVVAEVVAEAEIPETVVPEPTTAFCQFCDAKGPVKHMAICTKPK